MNENTEKPETKVSDELIDSTIKELCHLLKKADDEAFFYDFFKCLFTPPELKDFANRWLLVKEMDRGATQREIARKYGMSLCKITRGSKMLSQSDSAFKKMLELLEQEKK